MSFNLVIFVFCAIMSLGKSESFLTTNNCSQNSSNGTIWDDCKCPPNFTLLKKEDICVMLTEPRVWSGEHCVTTGTVDDFYNLSDFEKPAVRELIVSKNTDEFWISVRKDGHFGHPRSRLPGRSWGIVPDLRGIGISQHGASGNCLKLNVNISSAKGSYVDCSEKHPQLCIYRPKHSLLRLYCEDPEERTTRYSLYQDTCFKIGSSKSNRTKSVQVDSRRKWEIVNRLLNQTSLYCSTILSNTTNNVFLSYLHQNQLLLKNYSSLANDSSCVAYQRKLQIIKPQLNLNYDRVVQKLLLSITNSRFLWRESDLAPGFTCFTGADLQLCTNVTIKQKLWPPQNATNASNDVEIYELTVRDQFPSPYWCEGHAVANFTLVRSQRVVEQKKEPDEHIFALRMQVQEHLLRNIEQDYSNHLASSKTRDLVQKVRMVIIESTKNNKIQVLLHVAAKYNGQNATSFNKINDIPLELLEGNLDHYKLKLQLENMFKEVNDTNYTFMSINSTEMCLPEPSDRNGTWWPTAPIGQSVTLHQKNLCLLENGLLPYRKCLGDRIYGGAWESVEKISNQCSAPKNNQTKTLASYYEQSSNIQVNAIEGALQGINDVIREYTKKMVVADVVHVSGSIENFRKTLLNNGTNNTAVIANKSTSYYCGLSDVLSRMMDVEERVMYESQSQLNATNRLLDSTEDIINQLSSSESLRIGVDRNCPNNPRGIVFEQGTMLLRKPKFVLLIADPEEANITGMALIRKGSTVDDNFDSYVVRLLTMDDSVEDILVKENLEIASFVPRTLVDKMKQLRSETGTSAKAQFRVVISVYFNDRIFIEALGEQSRRSNGKIISVTVPGYGSELPEKLPIFVRERDPDQNSSCEFWKFAGHDGEKSSRWSSIGCEWFDKKDNVNLCKCTHMTSFSRIFLDSFGAEMLIKDHSNSALALDMITLVGCVASLLGIVGIFMTAILFPQWTDQFNSKILLHLSLAVAIELMIFTFAGHTKRPEHKLWCAVQGATLHYIILVTFMWMLVIAHLQFMQFVKVMGELRPTHCVLKGSILSWGLPLAPVGYFFYTERDLYVPHDRNPSDICYPHGEAQIYGLLIPIALILMANIACFLVIMYNVFRVPDNLTRSTKKNMAQLQLRLFVLLFFQLGLSWMFGMMVVGSGHLVWSYLFCFTAPYQGLMLFVNFILLQPSTRRLWSKKVVEVITENYDKFAVKKSTSSSQPWL